MNARTIGRQPGELTKRFAGVSTAGNSLYIASFSNGVIKIGFSNCPRERVRQIAFQQRREGVSIDSFYVYPGAGGRAIEAKCIRAIAAVATPMPRRIEYFTGISFDEAKAVMDATLA